MDVRRQLRLPRTVREQHVLDAALAVFARSGFHAAAMDEIAGRAGVSKPMVYLYLGPKEALYLAAVRREVGILTARLTAAVAAGSAAEQRLWLGIRAGFGYVEERREGWALLRAQARGLPCARELAEVRRSAVVVVASLIEDVARERAAAQDPREAEALAEALVGAGAALADWWVARPGDGVERVAARLMNLVWLGFDTLLDGRVWTPEPLSVHG